MSARSIVVLLAATFAGAASGQNYPNRPVRIIPGQPGGGGYFQMLTIKDILASRLGQAVVLESRAAALMGGILARAQPDGYTLLAAGDTVWFAPLLGKTDYDTLMDFAAVSRLASAPLVLVVHPSLQVNSVRDLIAMAKTKPGALNYSSAAKGSSYHLSGEMFKSMTGVNIVAVPYVGAGPTVTAVISGEVQLTFAPTAVVAQFIKAGKLKALAHTGVKPTPLAPDLTSIAASGLPGYEYATVNALFAPATTPAGIIKRLNQEFGAVLAMDDVKEKFLNFGAEARPSSPEELAAEVKSKYGAIARLIKAAGISGS